VSPTSVSPMAKTPSPSTIASDMVIPPFLDCPDFENRLASPYPLVVVLHREPAVSVDHERHTFCVDNPLVKRLVDLLHELFKRYRRAVGRRVPAVVDEEELLYARLVDGVFEQEHQVRELRVIRR